MTNPNPFPWDSEGGIGHGIRPTSPETFAHELLSEEELTSIKEHPLFIGVSIPRRRFALLTVAVVVILGILLGRAFWMQVVEGAIYRGLAEDNRIRREVLLPRRGIIRDRNGVVLAENIPSFDVRVIENLLPIEAAERTEALAKLGRAIGSSIADIEQIFASSTDPDESVVVKRDLSYERAISVNILSAETPAVRVAVGSKRKYTTGTELQGLSHVLGYVGAITRDELAAKRSEGYRQIDTIGKTGVEQGYESTLRGRPGEILYEVDSRHRITAIIGERQAYDGSDLHLSIDARLQKISEDALRRGLSAAKVPRGAVVAMDPRDGSLLAVVSLPSYDNNFFSGTVSSTQYAALLQNPDNPLLPRAWAGVYPSGSTAKPVIAAAALAEGVISPNTSVLSVGGIRIGPWFFPDWSPGGHGVTNVRRAISMSVNTFFYHIGGGYDRFVGLGVDRLTDWMRRFGLGSKTGVDVPGESAGFVPSQEWKQRVKKERWFIGDTYNLSIGQGDLLVTPLQVARFTAEIANGGFTITPHFALSTTSTAGARIAPADVIQTVRLGMRDTVVSGSGRSLANLPVPAAGKTGTAQWRSDRENHAWFTSFAPFEKPEIVVTVLIEEGVEGSRTAVPVAKEILQAWSALR